MEPFGVFFAFGCEKDGLDQKQQASDTEAEEKQKEGHRLRGLMDLQAGPLPFRDRRLG